MVGSWGVSPPLFASCSFSVGAAPLLSLTLFATSKKRIMKKVPVHGWDLSEEKEML